MSPGPPDWRPVATDPPPEGVVVETCVRDIGGDRRHLPLWRRGRGWSLAGKDECFIPYRPPTHWRPLT